MLLNKFKNFEAKTKTQDLISKYALIISKYSYHGKYQWFFIDIWELEHADENDIAVSACDHIVIRMYYYIFSQA